MRSGNRLSAVGPFYARYSIPVGRFLCHLPFLNGRKCQNPPYAIVSRLKMVNFTAACSGVSIRKHCVCAYAHKNRRLCDSAYLDDLHKSVYSSKTERAIELKLSRTM